MSGILTFLAGMLSGIYLEQHYKMPKLAPWVRMCKKKMAEIERDDIEDENGLVDEEIVRPPPPKKDNCRIS